MTELYVWPAPDPATCVLAVRSWRRSDYPRPSRPNRRRKLDRDAELVALFDAGGVTQHQLAERFGISHQRVSQILKNAGRDPLGRQRMLTAAANAEKRQRVCKACGRTYETGPGRGTTCSMLCAEALRRGRRYLDPDFYELERRMQGRGPEPPNRRYTSPKSRVVWLLHAIGRDDLLPAPDERPRPPRCRVTTKAGTLCSRSAASGDTVCHIHRGLIDGAPINQRSAS